MNGVAFVFPLSPHETSIASSRLALDETTNVSNAASAAFEHQLIEANQKIVLADERAQSVNRQLQAALDEKSAVAEEVNALQQQLQSKIDGASA